MTRHIFAIVPTITLIAFNAAADISQHDDRSTADSVDTEPQESSETKGQFGRRGQLILTSGTQFDMRRTVIGMPLSNLWAHTSVSLAPSVDYLLTDRMTLGGSIGLGFTNADGGNSAILFSVSARVGYLLPLGAQVSLWPQASVTYGTGFLGYADFSSTSVGGSLPVVIQLAPHFIVGVGPDFSMTKSNFNGPGDSFVASSGMTTMIGGFI